MRSSAPRGNDSTRWMWQVETIREKGDLMLDTVISCGPPVGLKEIVEYTQLTVEGVVSRVDSALTPKEDRLSLYTDYVIDVTRIFRMAPAMVSRATPGATEVSPFVAAAPVSRAGASPLQVRVRALYHGRLALEGGVVTEDSGFRMLTPGEHVIVSAYFNRDVGQWLPFGVFTVRDGRVVHSKTSRSATTRMSHSSRAHWRTLPPRHSAERMARPTH